VEDIRYERRRDETCVDKSDHHALGGDGDTGGMASLCASPGTVRATPHAGAEAPRENRGG
jgi:hypothetical protein